MKITPRDAVAIIRHLEPFAAAAGFHTALTGSVLYKGESEKDHAHRDELPVNGDGFHFYTHDGGEGPIHYILKESLKRKAADGEESD